MKRFHLIFGVGALLVFILTGQYMALYQGYLHGMPAMPRLLFRSRHIYILLGGLLNLALGTYLTRPPGGWRRRLQCVGSVLTIIATCLFVMAFVRDPRVRQIDWTPFSFYG